MGSISAKYSLGSSFKYPAEDRLPWLRLLLTVLSFQEHAWIDPQIRPRPHANVLPYFFSWSDSPLVGLGPPHSRGLFFLDHTRHTTVGRTPLDE